MRHIAIGVITFVVLTILTEHGYNYQTWLYWVAAALCCGLGVVSALPE